MKLNHVSNDIKMIKGNNVYLRALEAEDLDLLYKWENDPKYWSLAKTIIPFNKATLKAYVTAFHDLIKDSQYRYIICRADNDAPVGCLDIFEFQPIHRNVGIGILIYPELEKQKGFGLESIQLTCEYLKQHLNIKNVFCNILESNNASIQLFEKAGFQLVGTKKDWHFEDGQFLDEHLYIKAL